MTRNKFTVELRNKLASMAMDCDSAAAVNSMTRTERETLQAKLREAYGYIDKNIFTK